MRVAFLVLMLGWVGCSAPGAAPSLDEVVPPQVDTQVGGAVELRGANLKPAVTLDFDRPSQSVVNAAFTAFLIQGAQRIELTEIVWQSTTVIAAAAPGGLAMGRYDVHLVDPQGRELVLADGLEVVDCLVTTCVQPDGGPVERDGGTDGGEDAGEDAGDAGEDPFDAGWMPCTDFTYEDRDLDTFGLPDSGDFLCGTYRSTNADDCNDGDGLTHPSGVEVCNQHDDDCDGTRDEGACADAGLSWEPLSVPGPTWHTAWSWAPGMLWVAGDGEARVRGDGGDFNDASGGCPNNLTNVWASASGDAVLAGGNNGVGRVAPHELGSPDCGPYVQLSDPLAGLVGFDGDGGAEVVGLMRNRRLVRGRDGVTDTEVQTDLPATFMPEDLHGVSPQVLYTVGADVSVTPPRMKVFRLQDDGGWRDEAVERLSGIRRGSLRAVWVLDAEHAVAVGDQGIALARTPFGWRRLPRLPSGQNLTGVRAFGPGRFYTVEEQGLVRRWNGLTWEVLYDGGVELNDLTGTSEEDLWGVGAQSTVVHWPE